MRRSRFRRFGLLIAFPGILFIARAAYAQDDAVSSAECCIDMLFPIGARTVALGAAVTARPGEDASFVNPAGLAFMRDDQFYAHRSSLADAKVTTLGVVFVSKDVGAFGIAYHLVDFGDQETTDEFGNPTGSASIIYQQLIASFGTRMRGGWSAGINYRLYDFRPTCSGTSCEETAKPGTTHMVDAGLVFEPRFLPTARLGAAIAHLGFPLQVNNAQQADPTPARLRVGAAYEAAHHFTRDTSVVVWLHADAIQRIRNGGSPAVALSAEVILDNTIYFRAGHATSGDGTTSGATGLGIGLKYQRFDVSVAKTLSTSELFSGEPFHVSFGVTF